MLGFCGLPWCFLGTRNAYLCADRRHCCCRFGSVFSAEEDRCSASWDLGCGSCQGFSSYGSCMKLSGFLNAIFHLKLTKMWQKRHMSHMTFMHLQGWYVHSFTAMWRCKTERIMSSGNRSIGHRPQKWMVFSLEVVLVVVFVDTT